ncbi:MAG TPA: ABC transporter ATP-binding protein [Elusimicrobia bacterium]|nr:ABC transporter ATP-binding protein [Elusimicrobiota bacterium]
MNGPAFVLEGVRRSFGSREVLRGVTARAQRGRVIGLLGRNGEGKTTLMRILLDMLEADAGRVEVLGESPDGTGRIRGRVGYVPERPAFHDSMTAGEVLELRARFFDRWDRERARALASTLGLALETRVGGASKGTLAKLAWVCAAAHDPELFLLDEPTSGLDALVREEVLTRFIEELQDAGKTLFISNHRMEELGGLLDEVWLLAGGVIAEVFEAERLRREARRVEGRLKDAASVPEGLRAVRLDAPAPLAAWALFDAESSRRLLASGALDAAQESPLTLEESLKRLLALGGRHD